MPAPRSVLPRQYVPSTPTHGSRVAGDTLTRTQPQMREAVADAALFLAGATGSRITGQTLRLS